MQHSTRRAASRHRIASLPITLLVALTALACGDGEPPVRGGGDAPAPAVEAVPARSGALPVSEILSGTVQARNQVAIHPEIEARITAVEVRSGDAVAMGQILVRLDDSSSRERSSQAEAALRLAQASAVEARAHIAELDSQIARTRSLVAQKLLPVQDLDTQEAQLAATRARASQADARVDEARASLEERRADLGRTVVRSPIAGQVGQRDAEPGMLADTGKALFLVGDLDDLIVQVPLTEALLARVAVGTLVELSARTLESPVRAAISRISPFLDAQSFSTTAEIDLRNPDGRLRPGMFVSVRLLLGESERATLIPTSCLWENPATGTLSVFQVIDTDRLEEPATAPDIDLPMPPDKRRVERIDIEHIASGREASAVSGIAAGDWIVTVGQHLLEDELRVAQSVSARVRATTWERVLELEALQREDLLAGFLARHRIIAATYGAEIPQDAGAVDRLLAENRAAADPTGGR